MRKQNFIEINKTANLRNNTTICPKSSILFYIVTYNILWVTTSWTNSIWSLILIQKPAALKVFNLALFYTIRH